MTSRLLFSLILLMTSVAAEAQVYKWVDANGNVTYSDVPPPKSAVKVESRSFASSDAATVALPFELAQAVRSMPVTLYTTANCTACDDGRSFLKQNGIPFSEKTVNTNADMEKVATITTSNQFPLILVGRSKISSYNPSDWRRLLSLAGYPEANILPADYIYPAAQPAAPAGAAPATRPAQPRVPQQQAPADDPNTFHF